MFVFVMLLLEKLWCFEKGWAGKGEAEPKGFDQIFVEGNRRP